MGSRDSTDETDTWRHPARIFAEWRAMTETERMELLETCISHREHDCLSCCVGEQVVAESWGLA